MRHDVIPYPAEVKALLTPQGFENAFHNLWGSDAFQTRENCYETLEAEYEHLFGLRKYEDYNSFRNCLAYRRKKLGGK
jgi:hypothetical protein